MTRRPLSGAQPDPVRVALALVSGLGAVGTSAVYIVRPTSLDALTVWPLLTWAAPGAFLALVAASRRTWKPALLALLAWVAALGGIAEEPRALLRGVSAELRGGDLASRPADALRVISLNCAGGSLAAAAEALAHDPDVVLIQESPGAKELAQVFPASAGWQTASGADTAVVVRGTLQAVPQDRADRLYATVARAGPCRHSTGALTAISVHFTPPSLSAALWRPSVWRASVDLHHRHEYQMARVRSYAGPAAAHGPVLVGGDFNAPGGDAVFRALRPYLRDTFAIAGQGWPDTITNEYPYSRIDQVWVSRHCEVVSQWVVRTANSDHRMVICEVRLRTARARGQPPEPRSEAAGLR